MAEDSLTTMIWKIKNFNLCPCMPGEYLCSPEFSVGSYRFCLHLYPRGNERNTLRASLSIFLFRIDDCHGKEILVNNLCGKYFAAAKNSIFVLPISEKELSWGKNTDMALSDKCYRALYNLNHYQMIIKCDIYEVKEIEDDNQFDDDRASDTLSNNLSDILKSGLYGDIVIHAGDEKFKVHKLILKNRCPALLDSLIKNKNNHEYSFQNNASVLQVVLQYLYSGKFPTLSPHEEIFDACVKYGIFHLEHAMKSLHSIICEAITDIPVTTVSFRWSVLEFSQLRMNQEIVYPYNFIKSYHWENEIQKICLIAVKSEDSTTSLQLKLVKKKNSKVSYVSCKVEISKPDSEPEARLPEKQSDKIIKKYKFLSKGTELTASFLSHSELRQVLCNDNLDMYFDISMSSGETNTKIEKMSMTNITAEKARKNTLKNIKLLQKDFRRLYNDMELPDVTLCVDGDKLSAHKVFLCGRSSVFAMMFRNDCLEKRDSVISITDIESKIVSKMLLYIYCGCMDPLSISDAIKLYAAADKYDLQTLKDKCGIFLKNNIDAENVSEIQYLADRHNDATLETCVNDFLKSNPKQTMEPNNTAKTRVLQTRRTAYVYKY